MTETLRQAAKRYGKMSNDERLHFLNIAYQNFTWKEIAEQVGEHTNTVRRQALKLGVKSRSMPDAQKRALATGARKHPTQGKQRSIEVKHKIGNKMSQTWSELSQQEYQYRQMVGKKSWDDKTEAEKQDMIDKAHKALIKTSQDGSKLERFLQQFLVNEGYRVISHKKHLIVNENLHLDLFLPEHRIVIEIDGPMHSQAIWGEENLLKTQKIDGEKNALVLSAGYVMIRLEYKYKSATALRKTADHLLGVIQQIEKQFPDRAHRLIKLEQYAS